MEDKIPNAIKWLLSLYNLIYEKCTDKPEISRRDNRIFPNQHGNFCCINDLKADSGIDEAYKEAATLIGIDYKSELLDIRIRCINLTAMTFNDAAYRMINRAQEYGVNPATFYNFIIGLKSCNVTKQNDFISIYDALNSDTPITVINVNNFSERLLNNALEYWCKIICNNISKYNNLSDFFSAYAFETVDNAETWISEYVKYLDSIDKTDLLDKYPIIPNQNGSFKLKSSLYKDSDNIPDFMKDVCCIAGMDFREDAASIKVDISKIIPRKKGYKEVSEVITRYIHMHKNNIKVDSNEKEAFNKTYRWLRERKDDLVIKQHFQELLDHLYWFYNDDEISDSISKANDLDNILSKFGISDINQLEIILTRRETDIQSPRTITEDLLCQYGISSEEELQRLIDSKILGDDFLHYSEGSFDKFKFVQQILQRALINIQNHLRSLQGYDLTDSILIHKTIFTVKKDGREIYIIARPSDYGEVILYYDAEIDTLDYTKDFELWIENGKTEPEKLTFGKILRLTGVNRIPLRRIR